MTTHNPATRQLLAILSVLLLITAMAAPGVAATDGLPELSPYSVASASGSEIYEFGDASFRGSLAEAELDSPVVGLASHPNSAGYWVATSGGDVYAFGTAGAYGDAGNLTLAAPIVDITATPSGNGYWLTGGDGGVMSFGDAAFHGSAGGIDLVAPIAAMVATPSGGGYWLAASDGGIFAYGDAIFRGSAGSLALDRPVTAMASTGTGNGYWLFSDDGGVFSFGDAQYHGSLAGTLADEVVVDAEPSQDGKGYLLAGNLGTISAFGTAVAFGGVGAAADEPIAAIATTPTGDGYWLASTPGNSAFGPPIPADSGSGRRIVYSNGDQRVWIIEDGESVVTTYLVSGRKNDPKNGNYKVYSKSRNAWAGHDGITMEYMVRFAFGKTLAIGFHSIPKWGDGTPMQTEEQLGTYRSSGCVRQRVGQAKFLYDWADIGTPVIVVP